MTVLVGSTALAVDVGLLWNERRTMQTAADAAATAAATALKIGQSITSSADNVASLNGFTNGSNSTTITVNNPPASGPYAGNSNYVEVIIAQPEPTYFLRVLGYSSMNVSARAVGGGHNSTGCIYALNPTANNAVVISGGAAVTSGCGLLDNSSSSQALVVSGSSTLTAPSIGVVGNYTGTGYSSTPKTGIAPVSDPLAYLQPPTVGSCTATNYKAPSPSGTISQGTYCNGITVQGGATLNLNPGVYILNGGGLTVSGGANIVGNGVSFYNTGSSTYRYNPINLSGGSTTSLTAPASGTLAGILFFQDRSITSTTQNTVSGNSGTVYQGALYFPTTPLVYSGGSNGAAYTILVADTINFSGGSQLNNNYTSLANGSPVKSSALFE